MTGRSILLWRHGQTAWNASGRFQGQEDIPLDDIGLAQAAAAAPALVDRRPDAVVASDLQRAVSTARALGLPFDTDRRLREIYLGDWQGLDADQAAEKFPEEFDAWRRGADIRRGGGETYADVAVRAGDAVQERVGGLPDEGLLIVVTHGGTTRAVLGRLLGLPEGEWWRFGPLGNCRWAVLTEARGGWRLAEHNAGQTLQVGVPAYR